MKRIRPFFVLLAAVLLGAPLIAGPRRRRPDPDILHASAVDQAECLQASVATALPAVSSDATKALPDSIQWMPPGVHEITARNGKGEIVTVKLTVDAATAERIQAAFLEHRAAAERGEGDEPYFDFNHASGEASAHPTEFYWGGSDPKNGGVRARLAWTDAGAAAVRGKRYRRFSPSFYAHEGLVTNLPVNAGGLVNEAAFRRIAPISASRADNPNPEEKPMKTLLATLATLGLIKSADASEADAVSQVNAAHAALNGQILTAKDAAKVLQTDLNTANKTLADARKTHATAIVDAAIKAGRLAPQDEALKARWIGLIETDPKNADLLPQANPALATEAIVNANATDPNNPVKSGAKEHAFLVKARAAAKSHGDDLEAGMDHVSRTEPDLYASYRESLLKG